MYPRTGGNRGASSARQSGMTRRLLVLPLLGLVLLLAAASPAAACGGLVAPNGSVHLVRTSTLAAWHDGVEHYVTSFRFAGGGAEFGSIVPLPGVPTSVERGGSWTLQRLEREVAPPVREAFDAGAGSAAPSAAAQVLLETRIDALDITVLSGGGQAVGDWARQHGFLLTPDAPEVLDFYARRSPVFLAARFDAAAARAKGQQIGDGTPIQIAIPLADPWVPIRILGLGRGPLEPVDADVFVLTDDHPALRPTPGLTIERSGAASPQLLSDLRSDKGMSWVPDQAWLTYLRVGAPAGTLTDDLAIDVHGGEPSAWAAGTLLKTRVDGPLPVADGHRRTASWWWAAAGLTTLAGAAWFAISVRRASGGEA